VRGKFGLRTGSRGGQESPGEINTFLGGMKRSRLRFIRSTINKKLGKE